VNHVNPAFNVDWLGFYDFRQYPINLQELVVLDGLQCLGGYLVLLLLAQQTMGFLRSSNFLYWP